MVTARWKDTVIATSENTVVTEGNHYFPRDAVAPDMLEESTHESNCPWKGVAHYYHVVVDGERNENAAWYYPQPKAAAENIRDRIAFWKGVEVA